MSNQNKGADRKACPRAEWLIALFWVDRAKVPEEWPIEAALEQRAFRHACELMRDVVTDIPCTVPGCEYCGRPMTRGVAGNTHRDAMDQTFELSGRHFRIVVQEQTGQHWIAANSRDIPRQTVAEWLEEMARRVREGGK